MKSVCNGTTINLLSCIRIYLVLIFLLLFLVWVIGIEGGVALARALSNNPSIPLKRLDLYKNQKLGNPSVGSAPKRFFEFIDRNLEDHGQPKRKILTFADFM